jgi:hypothetical protein
MYDILRELNEKIIWKLNQFVNSLDIQVKKKEYEHIKFIDICLDEQRIPFVVFLKYDKEDWNDRNSFKGSQLPHKLLVFKKETLQIPEEDDWRNQKVIIRKNKFTGTLSIHHYN